MNVEELIKSILKFSDAAHLDSAIKYEQFNSHENARVHAFSFAFLELNHATRLDMGKQLSSRLSALKIGPVETFDVYIGHRPENLDQWFALLELMERPSQPQVPPEPIDFDSSQHPIHDLMREDYEQRMLDFEAEESSFQTYSRIYLDNLVTDCPLMLFLTNSDFIKLGKAFAKENARDPGER